MCYFITAALPAGVDLKRVRSLAGEHRLAFRPVENPHVKAQLAAGEEYFQTTRGHCDCGTVLGSFTREARRREQAGRRIEKLRKKGWSQEKIERSLPEKDLPTAHGPGAAAERQREEAERWIAFLRAALETGATHQIGVLLHWYSGSLDDERIAVQEHVRVPIAEVEPTLLMGIEEDVLYRFVL